MIPIYIVVFLLAIVAIPLSISLFRAIWKDDE